MSLLSSEEEEGRLEDSGAVAERRTRDLTPPRYRPRSLYVSVAVLDGWPQIMRVVFAPGVDDAYLPERKVQKYGIRMFRFLDGHNVTVGTFGTRRAIGRASISVDLVFMKPYCSWFV